MPGGPIRASMLRAVDLRAGRDECHTTLRVSGLYEFEGGLSLGGYGTGSMPVADARRVMDKAGVWDEIDVIAADGV